MNNRSLPAHVLPFVVFLGFLGLGSIVTGIFQNSGLLWLAKPGYFVYPVQSIACAGLLIYFWKEYDFGPLGPWYWGVISGLVVLAIWVSPQAFLGFEARTDGFDPTLLGDSGPAYWIVVLARFARLAIVVPLVEEIFWRGFLLRYLINDNFKSVPFGTFRPFSFFVVAVLFTFEHTQPDWIAAFITGVMWNALAIRTKSLFACVIAHAVTNLGLGLYVMATRQWGFW